MLKLHSSWCQLISRERWRRAVAAAFALAKQCGAEVHLLEVVPQRGPSLLDDRSHTCDWETGATSRTIGLAWKTRCMQQSVRGMRVRAVTFRGDATQDHRVVCAAQEGEAARHW